MGRTGKIFACEHAGVVPDMITTAKSLGAGFPIAAVVGKAEIMDAPHLGGVGGTYSGSPVACAAAIEAVKIISSPEFLAKAESVGDQIRRTLADWKKKYPLVGDVRGLGAMRLVEFVKDRQKQGARSGSDPRNYPGCSFQWYPADTRRTVFQLHTPAAPAGHHQ
jgi:4-aminobutyrate aminotransferase/(S)-3-amino-2-methylpropionate transaminase